MELSLARTSRSQSESNSVSDLVEGVTGIWVRVNGLQSSFNFPQLESKPILVLSRIKIYSVEFF